MNIYILGTLKWTIDILNSLNERIDIKGVIGLSYRKSYSIAGYEYLKNYCDEKKIKFIEIEDYSINNNVDQEKIRNLEIDVLLVLGWQRLVPSWLIEQCKIGAFGIHGSSKGINYGRGRSPQNWALILGYDKFYLSLFRLTEGIDDGDVFTTEEFDLTVFDDIRTSYYKVCMLSAEMVVKLINSIKNGTYFLEKQCQNARYLPQRIPSDGQIDWNRTSIEIYNFVRALTRPYPGAFTIIDGEIIKVWKGIPFSINLPYNHKPGMIVKIFSYGEILVKTLDSFFLITDYECSNKSLLVQGAIFESCDFKEQLKNIVERHYKKYPDLKVSEDILNFYS